MVGNHLHHHKNKNNLSPLNNRIMAAVPYGYGRRALQEVYLLDLCIFSYHLHNQTLIWPLDGEWG